MRVNGFMRRLKPVVRNNYGLVYCYRKYKYEIRKNIVNKPKLELMTCSSETCEYEIISKKPISNITFNNQELLLKQLTSDRYRVQVTNENGKLVIDKYSFDLKAHSLKPFTTKDIMIVSDRYEKADDNGEHFYRWIVKYKPEYKCYFALSKTSSDWNRLEQEGFKLIDFDSKEMTSLYKQANLIVSSVASDYIENYKSLRYKFGAPKSKFVCLSHGVNFDLKFDYSKNLKINKQILSTQLEVDYFNNESTCPLFPNQYPKIGMSRTPDLLKSTISKDIIFMPTWTQELANNQDIISTSYYEGLEKLVNSPLITELLKREIQVFKIVIHPMLDHHLKSFKLLENEYFKILSSTEISYRTLISEANIFITDCSSVMFDALWLDKYLLFYELTDKPRYDVRDMKNEIGFIADSLNELEILIYEALSRKLVKKRADSKYYPSTASLTNHLIWEEITNE